MRIKLWMSGTWTWNSQHSWVVNTVNNPKLYLRWRTKTKLLKYIFLDLSSKNSRQFLNFLSEFYPILVISTIIFLYEWIQINSQPWDNHFIFITSFFLGGGGSEKKEVRKREIVATLLQYFNKEHHPAITYWNVKNLGIQWFCNP